MELIQKSKLIKFKKKNRGNNKLLSAIDKLISDIESSNWNKKTDVKSSRPDADCVHNDGFYFFNINIHRTMVLLEFEEGEAVIIWVGSHSDYDKTFKGNKYTIEKWLRNQQLI